MSENTYQPQMETVTYADRRMRPRVDVSEPVEVRYADSKPGIRARAVNVSTGGLFVTDCRLASIGDQVNCRMLLSVREPITVRARVAWVRKQGGDDQPAGMGLEFQELNTERAMKLRTLVARLQQRAQVEGWAGVSFDPFCESGTWADGSLLEATHGDAVAAVHEEERLARRALVLRLAIGAALLGAIALGVIMRLS